MVPENADTSSSFRRVRSDNSAPKTPDTLSPNESSCVSSLHVAVPAAKMDTKDSADRDAALARVELDKRLALIKAWEESEKTKAENKAYKRHSAVGLWENSKKASAEANLKRIEEKLERNKAECVEKMQNKVAEIHRSSEEKRALIEAQKGEDFLKIEEKAAKFRTRGYPPRKCLPCFGS
ncbi:remorin-like [Abrus precatorius]|uniref:Remorin-like n=1 Tax=Abrus precatorius TaxID=3816 RepID=A0A8B8KHC3_ABRPR|nr:remorin-like [Abrus precatorius]